MTMTIEASLPPGDKQGDWYALKDGRFVHRSAVLNEDERRLQDESALRLIWWGLRRKGGGVIAQGEVENFTATKLDDIHVIVTFAASFVDALLY